MEKTIKNEVTLGQDFLEYRKSEGVSFSDLMTYSTCPALYKYAKNKVNFIDTPACKFGRDVHELILEPQNFSKSHVITEKINRNTNAYKDLLKENEGKEVLFQSDFDVLKEIEESVFYHKYGNYLFAKSGEAEVSIAWENCFGTQSKSRLDYVIKSADLILDLKTTISGNPLEFTRTIKQRKYYMQAAYYIDAYKQATGHECRFIIIAVEKSAPYLVSAYQISDNMINQGREEYLEVLERINESLSSGKFNGYNNLYLY